MQLLAATRGSPLALWQTERVGQLLAAIDPNIVVEPVVVETLGDRRTDVPLSEIGGKGVFVKHVQAMILDGRADLAIHSGKDMPARSPDELVIAAVPERGDPRDCLVGARLADVPAGGTVATGSPRRRAQLRRLRPDISVPELRGNIGTRLRKAEDFDAIVMAKTALDRLGRSELIAEVFEPEVMLPMVAQGSLAVECAATLTRLVEMLSPIDHGPSRLRFDTERAFLDELGGDCNLPAGAYAEIDDATVSLTGMLASPDGSTVVHEQATGTDGIALGREVARAVLDAFGPDGAGDGSHPPIAPSPSISGE